MKYIISLSGGRDSAAAGIWFCQNIPKDCENAYFLTADTGIEPNARFGFYAFLDTFKKKIIQPAGFALSIVTAPLKGKKTAWAAEYELPDYSLPGFLQQSCSDKLKVRPMKAWRDREIGDESVTWVIGFRIDEGKESRRMLPEKTRSNSGDIYWRPFLKLNIGLPGVKNIMADAGIPEPDFYKWTSRSGCAMCFHKPLGDIVNALRYEPENYAYMEGLEQKTITRWGEKRARADFYIDRIPVLDKQGNNIIKKNGKTKLKIIRKSKKALLPGDASWDLQVKFFGRRSSPYVAQYKMTLREIRLAYESQMTLDLEAGGELDPNCGTDIPVCGI